VILNETFNWRENPVLLARMIHTVLGFCGCRCSLHGLPEDRYGTVLRSTVPTVRDINHWLSLELRDRDTTWILIDGGERCDRLQNRAF
jgi:hypothetical protein